MSSEPSLFLGGCQPLKGPSVASRLEVPAHHLVTHAVITGMTGSGKSGLVMVMVEEALRASVPVLVIDVKGDLPNLLLAFPSFAPSEFMPWVEGVSAPSDLRSDAERAVAFADKRRDELLGWGIDADTLARFRASTDVRVITPGASAGELLHVLSSLERRSARWDSDPESARAALGAAVSLLLRLLGRDPDPAKSREHVLLSVLAERRLVAGHNADLGALLEDVVTPPIDHVGALAIDEFCPKGERKALAAALNTLLASPTFSSWRQGTTLDVGSWMKPQNGKTPCVIVSVAHLDDEERALVLGVLLEEVLSWVRTLPGSQRLKALVMFDEVYGYLPPHPHNPPTKRPLVALMKQARAFGVGVVVATQNPMDLDYRALSNAGLWCIGRLQTDADRARVVEGLTAAGKVGQTQSELAGLIARLGQRWFLVRNAHSEHGSVLLHPRWAMSFMRGPMTRTELKLARGEGAGAGPR